MATKPKPVTNPVVLRPPVDVVRPGSLAALPTAAELPEVMYQPKLDGFRAVGCVLEDRVVLQSRSGRDLGGDFPAVVEALGALAPGTVVDGELVAWSGAHVAFNWLLRSPAAREREGIAVTFVIWDILAEPGRDLRGLPLAERWEVLSRLLADVHPPLQQIIATTSREEALIWNERMQPLGVEGLVVKTLNGRYRPGTRAGWWKIRHAETTDVLLMGVTGPVTRPQAVLVRLPDGRQETTLPRLTPAQAHEVARAVAGRLEPATSGAARVHWVAEPQPEAEVLLGTGRHGTVCYVPLRSAH
ncbi:DNA ligase [Kitasatospora indigofera]|uniref:ATP-dependent DNA ligase n=1 Tax=Kitasatospora indigofera TaxID=67307 RepID=UPI003633A3A6